MKAKITKRLFNSLQPQEKPFEVFDTETKGFLLRVEPTGVMTYYLAFRNEEGKRRRYRIGRHGNLTPAQARDIAGEQAALVAGNADIQEERERSRREAEKAKTRTLRGFIEAKYEPWVLAHRKTGQATLDRLKGNFDHLYSKPLTEINHWIIEKWRSEQIKHGKAKSTVNRDITALKAVLSKAVEWDMITIHPLAKVKPLKTDKAAKVRYLSQEEESRLREALGSRSEEMRQERDSANEWRANRGYPLHPSLRDVRFVDHLEPMVLLTINTGLRRGELFHLHWHDIDLAQRTLTVVGLRAKSGSTRHIPLNSEALEALRDWKKQATSKKLVFPGKNGRPMDNIKSAWSKLLKRAGVENFRWHDLRHHFASRLVMAGVALNTVRDLLGHADIKQTLRYAHLAPEHKAAAVEKLLASTPQIEPSRLGTTRQ